MADEQLPFTVAGSPGEVSRVSDAVQQARTDSKRAAARRAAEVQAREDARRAPNRSTVVPEAWRDATRLTATRLIAGAGFSNEADRGERGVARLRAVILTQGFLLLLLTVTLGIVVAQQNDGFIYSAAGVKTPSRPLVSLNEPTHTQGAVLSWAASTASSILNFGFHNIGTRLQESRYAFTDRGWTAFNAALEKSQFAETIIRKEQVITAAPIGAPVIVHIEDTPERRSWIVQLPIMVTTLSGKETAGKRQILTLEIVTVPATESLNGLAINNWIL